MQNDKGEKNKPCSCKQDWQRNDAHCCLGIEYECDTLEKGERVKAIWVQAENRFLIKCSYNSCGGEGEFQSITKSSYHMRLNLIGTVFPFYANELRIFINCCRLLSAIERSSISYLNARLSEILKEVVAIFGDESKQTEIFELIEKRGHADK